MSQSQSCFDVVVIGAGPAGTLAASLLQQKGYSVLVVEKQYFPRFSIGESLLPQCMEFLQEAGMLAAVEAEGFQLKNGALFSCADKLASFDFGEKLSQGWGTTYQVPRARFDQVLADEASRQGVEIRFGQTVTGFQFADGKASLRLLDEDAKPYSIDSRFVLDASGSARVLAKLLDLEQAGSFPGKTSIFTHVRDNIDDSRFDREKILITVHPGIKDVWFWLIPFGNARASLGVVAADSLLESGNADDASRLRALISESGWMAELLARAEFDTRFGRIQGYSASVKKLQGPGFALLGNAAEFLDPVFSSGVTIALKSASLAAAVLDRELRGLLPDWEEEFVRPLNRGVSSFREFVAAWYDGRLQEIIFASNKDEQVKRMICSILAGYAWDSDNPYVSDPSRLTTLAELCRQ